MCVCLYLCVCVCVCVVFGKTKDITGKAKAELEKEIEMTESSFTDYIDKVRTCFHTKPAKHSNAALRERITLKSEDGESY